MSSKKKRGRKNPSHKKKSSTRSEPAVKATRNDAAPPAQSAGSQPMGLLGVAVVILLLGTAGFFLARSWNSPQTKSIVGDRKSAGEMNAGDAETLDTDSLGEGPTSPHQLVSSTVHLPTMPGLKKQRFDSVVRNVADREDPVLDGWESERFNELANKQLKLVGDAIISMQRKGSAKSLETLVTDSFESRGIRPANFDPVFRDPSLVVRRGSTESMPVMKGIEGFRQILRDQAQPFAGATDSHFKFKIIRVEKTQQHTKTRAYFQIDGKKAKSAVQANSVWECRWRNDQPEPRLVSIDIENYEETVYEDSANGRMFADCTESIFRNSDRFARQLIYGIDHWTDQFDGAIARPAAGHGIAVGDVNGDGLDDVYLCQSPALPNLLLIQSLDGTVRDTAVEAGVNWLEGTRAALLADLDNDGDQDLVAVLGSKAVVQENDGTGKFRVATIITTPSSLFQINAVDFDGDRDLDLFICGYTGSTGGDLNDVFANPMPFHDANNGAPNVMLRNDGGWAFQDVTREVGLGQNNSRFSYASAWDDLDNDGDLDVYVANDFGRNNLYRNDAGKFIDIAAELDVEDIGPGMSAAWGDYNNDGHADIYVSNMFSSAGNRITHQKQFKTNLDETTKREFQRHARGNSLFENTGDGEFRDRSVELGITLGRWAWGSLFVDLNNDGWEDIYVANGFITADDNNDL